MIVVKFGGTSVGSTEKITHCAKMIKNEVDKGEKVVVVVSAQAGDTDRLSRMAEELQVSQDSADEIVSMGERISMRLMCAALNSLGVPSQFIDPIQEEWPVLTDSKHGIADIILKETSRRVHDVINPLLDQGVVPVLGGFIGKSQEGKVTTLGRGGSDITGVLLGHCLGANVYIVTDVNGVYSADPNTASDARLIPHIRIEELWDLGIHGAKVMHPRSLIYKTEDMNLKILSNEGLLNKQGTEIVGFLDSDIQVRCDKKEKSLVSVVGENMSSTPGLLKQFSQALEQINIYSISASTFSITFIVDADEEINAVHALHELISNHPSLRAVTSKRGIALITIIGRKFPQERGVIRKIGEALENEHIVIINITTSSCEVNVYVDWEDRKKAQLSLNQALKVES
jgi:aspartate kinase